MDAKQIVNDWLAKINPADAGMMLNQYGQCRLVSKGGTENCIVFVPNSASAEFFLFQDIASLPEPADARVYEELLKLNLPCEATRGGSIAFDTQTRNVAFVYSREIAITDIKTFCAILENFLNSAQEIKKRVQALLPAPGGETRPRKTAGSIVGTNRKIPFSSSKIRI
jgi:hypothetical protein